MPPATRAIPLRRRRARPPGVLAALAVWAAVALVAWLDSDRSPLALRPGLELHTAHVFAAIWAAIEAVAAALSTAASVSATYLAKAVAWFGIRFGRFMRSTGAMFSKAWENKRLIWTKVLKPALKWIDTHLEKLHKWLKDTFKPVFEWLKIVRDHVKDIYTRFVRPIIDTIEFIRAVNRVLLTFHVKVLQQLDVVLQKIEQRVDEPFLWIYTRLSQIQNFLDQILTLGGLFQRVTLIKSLEKYWPDWSRVFWTKQVLPSKPTVPPTGYLVMVDRSPAKHIDELRSLLEKDEGPWAAQAREAIEDLNLLLKEGRPN